MKNEFEYCKRIKALDESIVFRHKQYYCYATKVQISGIIPLVAPFRTGAYWDDIAFLGLMTPKNGNMSILGAGLLSFIPLLKNSMKQNLFLDCIEINEDILNIAKEIDKELNSCSLLSINYLCKNIIELPPTYFSKIDSLFIDIYDEFEISPIAIDPNFLANLKAQLKPYSLIAININDTSFDLNSKCVTRFFYESIKKHWDNILLARRASSTTMFFSAERDVGKIKADLFLVNLSSKDDYHFVEDASLIFSGQFQENLNIDLLKFETNFEKDILKSDTLLYKVISDLQQLSKMDILKLLKRGIKL